MIIRNQCALPWQRVRTITAKLQYNRQRAKDGLLLLKMDYFKASFNRFGEFDHFDDWDAEEEKEEGETTQGGDELNSLEDEKDELNTKTSTKCPVKHLEKNLDINFESFTAETLYRVMESFMRRHKIVLWSLLQQNG